MKRLALLLIRLATPAVDREWVLGDTIEEYTRIEQAHGSLMARRWLRGETWRVLVRAPRHRLAVRRLNAAQKRSPQGHALPESSMASVTGDLRHAVRRWASRPTLALTAMLTIGLGIGATTAIFSVVDGVLLRPLPWREPERLVSVYLVSPSWRTDPVFSLGWDNLALSWPNLRDLQGQTPALATIGAWREARPVIAGQTTELVDALWVSSALLPMLGVQPVAGRLFSADENETFTDSVLISYEAWQRRFGGDRAIVGRRTVLDDAPRTIIGVLPQGFRLDPPRGFGLLRQAPEFVVPFGALGAVDRAPTNNAYRVIARLAPGASEADAARQISRVLDGGEGRNLRTSRVVRLIDDLVDSSRAPLFMLLAASSLLLLIACANVTGLLLGDAGSRRHEMSVRRAIGAGRWRLARQMLVESVVLAIGGGALGVAAAWWITPGLIALAPEHLPRIDGVTIDARVLLFAVLLSAVTTVVFGVAPSMLGSSGHPSDALREARTAGRFRSRPQRLLVVGEIALAIVLLAGAALLGETLIRLSSLPVGFDPHGVLALGVQVPRDTASDVVRRAQLETDLLDRVRALPGVESAAGIAAPPFGGIMGFNNIGVEGRRGERLTAQRHVVTEGYFATMAMPIIHGRAFESSDASWQQVAQPPAGTVVEGRGVAVVSQELERRYFGGSAVGRGLIFGWTRLTVVGVVPDVKMGQYAEQPTPAFYLFAQQMPWLAVSQIVVRTNGAPTALVPALRSIVASVNNRLAITTVEPMQSSMSATVANERYRAVLSSVFGVAALLLAAVGLWGLLSRMVSERQREIGVRMAVGAGPSSVVRLVIGDGGKLVAGGLLLGVPTALAVARLIRSQLYGVEPSDPRTFIIVSVVLGLTALAAMLVPAIRASRLDPVETLRAS